MLGAQPDKNGRDAGELVARDPIGVSASNDIDTVLAVDADCVIYAPVLADHGVVERILRSGKNVVTPLGWWYPDRNTTARIEAACAEASVTLHGTGIHPGGITEVFPLMLSALSGSITQVRAEEFSDIRTYSAADVVRDIMLFGATPEVARTSIMLDVLATASSSRSGWWPTSWVSTSTPSCAPPTRSPSPQRRSIRRSA